MGCGEEYPAASGKTPGWEITSKDVIVEYLCGFKKLSLKRNHPRLLQTSLYCLQAWRAKCDVSIMIYDSDPAFPDLAEIAEVTDYVVSYACKGNITYALEREQLKDFFRRLVHVNFLAFFISIFFSNKWLYFILFCFVLFCFVLFCFVYIDVNLKQVMRGIL